MARLFPPDVANSVFSLLQAKCGVQEGNQPVSVLTRIHRHAKLSMKVFDRRERLTPSFLILFINSICNLTCEHCFYWRNLNRRDDLTYSELTKLSFELGHFENLNLSGGEPFIRPEFGDICLLFTENNEVKRIYVPTNGYFTDRTEKQLQRVFQSKSLQSLVCEISLDGMPSYHDRFRGNPRSFAKAMETYDMLADLRKQEPRLRIHANSVAMQENMEDLWQLTEFLHDRCPAMEHHNLAIIRGDRKNPSLQGPALQQYRNLYRHFAEVWKDRDDKRFGAVVEPMLQWAKLKTIECKSQYVPCTAGILTGVVYANGDVSVCETHAPLGNLRQKSFFEIWDSKEAKALRARIKAKECYCTNEVFLWPSIVFQPLQLAKAMVGAKELQTKQN
jgi:MoaA/NifB/PqqE/SkfB family radical SAM enzyme